jgi:uncharacterized protein (DUF488 family)
MTAEAPAGSGPPTLLTVGHSTRPIDEFLALLEAHGIARVVDVRRFPGSRRHPHFGRERLAAALAARGIDYVHEEELGGRRGGGAGEGGASPNRAWRNAQFCAYADHMAAPSFKAALARVLTRARAVRTAVMCAEAVPWRCHRQLIADAAVARGWSVLHVMEADEARPHTLDPAARVGPDGAVTYPGGDPPQSELF